MTYSRCAVDLQYRFTSFLVLCGLYHVCLDSWLLCYLFVGEGSVHIGDSFFGGTGKFYGIHSFALLPNPGTVPCGLKEGGV